jgi:hypothetical protein
MGHKRPPRRKEAFILNQKTERDKFIRLTHLERWARSRYQPEDFKTKEFLAALTEYSLITWAVGESSAKNYARIVQLRLTRMIPKPLEEPMSVLPSTMREPEREEAPIIPEVSKETSILDIIAGYRKANPEEFKPPPTDFHIIEENGKEAVVEEAASGATFN